MNNQKHKIVKSYNDSHITTRNVLFEKIPFKVICNISVSRLSHSSNTYSRNKIYDVQTCQHKEYYKIINGVLNGVFILKSDFVKIVKK